MLPIYSFLQVERQYTAAEFIERRALEVELQADEDEERKRKREVRTMSLIVRCWVLGTNGRAWLFD